MNKCINCMYFLNCKNADENIKNCINFIPRNNIIRINSQKNHKLKKIALFLILIKNKI